MGYATFAGIVVVLILTIVDWVTFTRDYKRFKAKVEAAMNGGGIAPKAAKGDPAEEEAQRVLEQKRRSEAEQFEAIMSYSGQKKRRNE